MKTLAVIVNNQIVRVWNVTDEDAEVLMTGNPTFEEGAE
jgi:hypothetical protein